MNLKIVKKCKNQYTSFFYWCGIVLYIVAYIGACAAPALTYWGYLSLCRKIFAVAISLTIPAALCLWIAKDRLSNKTKWQMLIGYTLFSIIFSILMLRNLVNQYSRHTIFMILEAIVLYFGLVFWWKTILLKRKYSIHLKNIFINEKFLICNCVLILIFSLEQIFSNLRWDSIHYYAYIERIKDVIFTPNDILLFKASGHLSYGYVLLYSIGESIWPGFGYGVRIETIFIFIISIIFLNQFLKVYFPEGQGGLRKITVALYSVTPVILGPIHNIDVEMLTLALLIIIFYCYTNKYYIICGILATFFVFTKETCAVLLAAFLAADILFAAVSSIKKRNLKELFGKETIVRFSCMYIPLLLFLLHISANTTWGTAKAAEHVDRFNTWGINKIVITNKLEQLFIMNFSWLVTFVILGGILCSLAKHYKLQKKVKVTAITLQIAFTYGFFLALQLGYITYTFPRYLMVHYFFMAIFFNWALNQILLKNSFKVAGSSIIIILTFIQNFYSLDFISNKIFDTMEIGKTKMLINSPIVYLDNIKVLTGENAKFLALSPYGDINRQWSYFDELINKFLTEIDYTDETLIVYPDSFSPRSENIYFGMWKNTYYDTKKDRLIQIMDNLEIGNEENLEFFNAVIAGEDLNTDSYKDVYYLEFPYDEISSAINLNSEEAISVSYKGWELKAYKMKE